MSFSGGYETPDPNPSEDEIRNILEKYRTVAVVGLSDDPSSPSYEIGSYLKEHGYRVIPVNPRIDATLGEKSYPDLKSIPVPVDIVDVFRRSEAVPEIVDQAIGIGAKVVWLQAGIVNNEAARKARDAGLKVVQARCIRNTHEFMDYRA